MYTATVVGTIVIKMQRDAAERQEEILALVRDGLESDASSSLRGRSYSSGASSGAVSLLPAVPKIFHGREVALQDLLDILLQVPARVAILGTGGMGKTSLATAALHDLRIAQMFSQRYFVSCESVYTVEGLLICLASYIGIAPSNQITKSILRYFSERNPSILVLDNFETPWESAESRPGIEEFLGLLTDIPQLALVVTMRGVERPGKVRWTRPFLAPLEPLDPVAARQIYVDIADEPTSDEEQIQMEELLELSDNLPLAITLLAHIASFEGCGPTLARYRSENTSLISQGYDKRSNLHKSIMLSLCSRRLTTVPDSIKLLGLLSLLPDGISDVEMNQCDQQIRDIAKCKSTLVRTALAFLNPNGRLRVLAPIREYIQKFHPPIRASVRPLQTYLCGLVKVWNDHRELFSPHLVGNITSNLGNIRSLLQHSICGDIELVRDTGYGILDLDAFLHESVRGCTDLFRQLPDIIKRTSDKYLDGYHICALLGRHPGQIPVSEAGGLITAGIMPFRNAMDSSGEVQVYNAATQYYLMACDRARAAEFNAKALYIKNSGVCQRFMALMMGCDIALAAGRHHDGILLAIEGQAVARQMGNFQLESRSMQSHALLCASLGQLSHALELCTKAHALLVACGLHDSIGAITIIDIEAFVYEQRTDYLRTREAYLAIMRLTSLEKSPFFHLNSLMHVIHMDTLIGDSDIPAILPRLDAAAEIAKQIAFPHAVRYCDFAKAEVQHRQQGQPILALVEYKRCLEFFRASHIWGACICLQNLSDAYLEQQEIEEASRWAVTYFAQARSMSAVHTHHAFQRLGDVFLAWADEETALSLYMLSLEGFTGMDVHRGRAECMTRIGSIFLGRGDVSTARKMWTDARELFMRSCLKSDAAEMERQLACLPVIEESRNLPQI
ncbi:hypothetical protein B0H10DRAFT_338086 [Mycena sp. CBHHK59/15]|nr:hypothetical protein B0H10DRAFT_338086 [Mycena sp. CBHHK59/15]